jgi:hypothetical protein
MKARVDKASRREQLKLEVRAALVKRLREAMEQTGRDDAYTLADQLFPEVPMDVRIDAVLTLEDEDTEAWWDQLEHTIDEAVLHRAITGPAKSGG